VSKPYVSYYDRHRAETPSKPRRQGNLSVFWIVWCCFWAIFWLIVSPLTLGVSLFFSVGSLIAILVPIGRGRG
jgi:hypothetical protein